MRNRSTPVGVVLLVALALSVSGCASTAPGADPVVVNAEKGLSAADAVYESLMGFYFDHGKTIPPAVQVVFEKIRVSYDPSYKAAQAALDLYKSGKARDLGDSFVNLRKLLSEGASVAKGFGLDLFQKYPWLGGAL